MTLAEKITTRTDSPRHADVKGNTTESVLRQLNSTAHLTLEEYAATVAALVARYDAKAAKRAKALAE